MRTITNTHTGRIITDTDLVLEYLYVGDYGKENNIKASFLGYDKRIEKVEHQEVNIEEKLVVTVSSQKGCPMKCNFCDCPKLGFKGNATVPELLTEIMSGIALSGIRHGKRLNVHFARMGEPTFNRSVITAANLVALAVNGSGDVSFDEYHPVVSTMMPKSNKFLKLFLTDWVKFGFIHGGEDGYGLQFSINTLDEKKRNEMFRNKSLSLEEIGKIIAELPVPKKRKYTLNFAVTSESSLDVDLMNMYFDKDRCIVKITPIHKTVEAVNEGYEIVTDFDVYEKFEQPLVKDGWDVIVFIPSKEEDEDRITCGNALIALEREKKLLIGGKEYQIGQHIRIISAKDVLHYEYGMKGHENEEMAGLTGTIVAEATSLPNAVVNLKLDAWCAEPFHNGMTRLFKDDEIELINEEDEAWKNAYGR